MLLQYGTYLDNILRNCPILIPVQWSIHVLNIAEKAEITKNIDTDRRSTTLFVVATVTQTP